jgi:hypothetical protein
MNVVINHISEDLDTTVKGMQTAITLFFADHGDPRDPLRGARVHLVARLP